jgi:hypothetical protein
MEQESVLATGARPVKMAALTIDETRYRDMKRARDICLLAVVRISKNQCLTRLKLWADKLIYDCQSENMFHASLNFIKRCGKYFQKS